MRKKKENKETIHQIRALEILNKWRLVKRRIANYLQKKSELLSIKKKKYCLAIFCGALSGISIGTIINAATTEEVIPVTKISRPAQAPPQHADSIISKHEYERVMQIKSYLLELENDSSKQVKFDSIMLARPQLMDSINQFEKMYLQQK